MIMTEETPKRPYSNLKWYPDSRGNMTIREAEAGLNNCLAEIKRLRAVLQDFFTSGDFDIVTTGDEEATQAWIKRARAALGEKDNGND